MHNFIKRFKEVTQGSPKFLGEVLGILFIFCCLFGMIGIVVVAACAIAGII